MLRDTNDNAERPPHRECWEGRFVRLVGACRATSMLTIVKKLGEAVGIAALSAVLLSGCAAPEPAPTVTVTTVVTQSPAPAPTVTVTVTPAPAISQPSGPVLDLTTDIGLCDADMRLSNLELNDALAPILGYPADREQRTTEQDDAIRAYKNAAFERACPSRAS